MIKLSYKLECMLDTAPDGPNCWNATQMFHKPRTRQRHTTEEEMETWLGTHTREVKGVHKEGDIAVFYDTYGLLTHTAVKLGHGKWFHKAGWIGRYEIEPLYEIKRQYLWGGYIEFRRMKK